MTTPTRTTTRKPRLGPAFRIFQGGVLCSDLADGSYRLAVPLLAIGVSAAPLSVSIVAAAIRAPWLLITLPAGVLADRHDPLTLMRWASRVRLPIVAVLLVMAVTGTATIWALAVCAFVIGSCGAVVDLAAQSLPPRLLSRDLIPRANASLQTGQILMGQFAGPALSGVLVAVAGGGVLAACGCYVVTLVALDLLARRVGVRCVTQLPADGQRAARSSMRTLGPELREGARAFLARRDLVGLAGIGAANNLGFSATITILPIWVLAPDGLASSAAVLGLIVGAPAVGALIAGPCAAPLLARIGPKRVLRVSAAAAGLCFLAIAVPEPAAAALAMGIYGALLVILNVTSLSHRQTTIGPAEFGRVNSVFRWIVLGVTPVGSLLGGLVAELAGSPAVFVLSGALVLGSGLLLSPLLRTGLAGVGSDAAKAGR